MNGTRDKPEGLLFYGPVKCGLCRGDRAVIRVGAAKRMRDLSPDENEISYWIFCPGCRKYEERGSVETELKILELGLTPHDDPEEASPGIMGVGFTNAKDSI